MLWMEAWANHAADIFKIIFAIICGYLILLLIKDFLTREIGSNLDAEAERIDLIVAVRPATYKREIVRRKENGK
jgi:hypothetical protein